MYLCKTKYFIPNHRDESSDFIFSEVFTEPICHPDPECCRDPWNDQIFSIVKFPFKDFLFLKIPFGLLQNGTLHFHSDS